MKTTLRSASVALAVLLVLGLLGVPAATAPADRPGVQRFASATGRSLRAWEETVRQMELAHELRVRDVQQDTLIEGRSFERLDQYYKGVPVFGGQVVRETDGKTVLSVSGSLYPRASVDTTPVVEPEQALAAFASETGLASAPPQAVPELMILPKDDGTFVLVYRVAAFVGNGLPVVFVNAATGAIEMRYDNLQRQQAAAVIGTGYYGDEKKMSVTRQGGTYEASDQMRPTKIVTNDLRGDVSRTIALASARVALVPSDIATNTSTHWLDPVVVDTHAYLEWTYDYFYKRFAWKGLDNRDGRPIYAIVHPVKRGDLTKYDWKEVGDFYANALFCGQCGTGREDILVFGEGLPPGYYLTSAGLTATYFAASIDIVAHEYAHGVSGYTAGLIYRNESGALSEAFSDVMGAGVEFYFQPAGTGPLKADYLQGEDTFVPSRAGAVSGTRSLADPSAYGDPDHYSKRYTGTDDDGGVHTNAAIAGHAFYLAIEGGTNKTSGLTVHGVGGTNREQIEKAFFRGFVSLPSDATFSLARQRTIQSAKDLYGAGSPAERAVTEAWTAVGVQ